MVLPFIKIAYLVVIAKKTDLFFYSEHMSITNQIMAEMTTEPTIHNTVASEASFAASNLSSMKSLFTCLDLKMAKMPNGLQHIIVAAIAHTKWSSGK